MACGSGCCGPPAAPAVAVPEPSVPPLTAAASDAEDGDRGSCCGPPSTASEKKAAISATDEPQDGAVDACCGDGERGDCCKPGASQSTDDGCCTTNKSQAGAGAVSQVAALCKDGCCVPPPTEAKSARCEKKCCDEESGEGCRADAVAPPPTSGGGVSAGCCAQEKPAAAGPKEGGPGCQDQCCSSQDDAKSESLSCKDECCGSSEEKAMEADPRPSCCKGKTTPCCDTTCLDRIALRECSDGDSSCSGSKAGKPCADHSRKTRQTYASKLEALGCICRALIALGQETCCLPQERPVRNNRPRSSRSSRSSVQKATCTATGCADSECGKARPRARGSVDKKKTDDRACTDSCCDVPQQEPPEVVADTSTKTASTQIRDLEKGVASAGKDHVILSISGMTCTGCETKLKRTLGMLPAVQQVKVSLVLSRAEFDLTGEMPAADVVKHLERTTEFKFERITNKGSSIEIIAPGADAAGFVQLPWPLGVTDMRLVDGETVNISFDSKVVGARDLLEGGWEGGPVKLAPPRPDPTLQAGSKHVRNLGYMTLLSAILTIPVLVMAWAPLPEHEIAYGSASLALATIVQFTIAGPFYPKALKGLIFSRVVEMDLLIVLSTSAAYIFSVVSFGYMVSGRPLSSGEFFETSTLLVTLIMVGRWVSALARQKAVESISIQSLQTEKAVIVTDTGDKEIDARLLQYGDVFKVAPEARVPTDGTVLSGSSEIDESMITGESVPVVKQPKSPVIAGSVNGSGALVVRLTRVPGDNTISTIATMVDEAKLSKPQIQDIADRVASYFVPVVVVLAILTFVIWIAVGVAVRKQSGAEATIQAITYAITVLIVSCPCAIGLAVPMVIVIASGVAAERGVVFKSAEAIQVAQDTEHVVFDKTGTLTEGKLAVATEVYIGDDIENTKALLLGLAADIKHPVSVAVASHLRSQGVAAAVCSEQKTLVGKGVQGKSPTGSLLQAGNCRWLSMESNAAVQSVLSNGRTAFCFAIDGTPAAILGLEDSIRPDAASTVDFLSSSGISVHIISGDDHGAVCSVAAQLNIPEVNIRSRCTPGDKKEYIEGLLAQRRNPRSKDGGPPVVIFCGDGTNDAAALAQATVGIHMNEGGTDIAQSAADVVLMRPDLGGVATAIRVSRRAMRRVAFNFGWSFVYNLFAVLLGAGAFVKARIPPEFAGLGELVSVLPVIAAAILLRWSKV